MKRKFLLLPTLVIFSFIGVVLLAGGYTGIHELPGVTYIDYSTRRGTPDVSPDGDLALSDFANGNSALWFTITALGGLFTGITATAVIYSHLARKKPPADHTKHT
jgi:hypothetical protein